MKRFFKLPALLAWVFGLCLCTHAMAQVCDNKALAFDGTGDYISLSTSATLVSGDANFTAETWFYANTTGNIVRLMSLSGNSIPSTVEVGLLGSGALFIYWRNTPGNGGTPLPVLIPTTPADLTGACHHLALTRNGGVLQVYLDGILVSTNAGNVGPFSFDEFLVGHSNIFPGQDWEGQIDEIRLWSTVRSLQQIKDYKDCSLSGTSSGLEVNWPIDFEGSIPYGDNSPTGLNITQVLDAATTPTVENGTLHGFDLTAGNLNSNFICNACPQRYLVDISDQVAIFPASLIQICEGDKVHFCVIENGNPVTAPAGSMVMWESSDGGGPFIPDPDLSSYTPASNALCFPVKKGIITNSDCGNIGQGYVDRTYRAKIIKKMGAETCTSTTEWSSLRICCPPTCGNISIVPNLQPPWCEGDNVSMTVFLQPCDPWLPFGPSVTIDWCLIDENGVTPLPQYQNQLSFGGFQTIVGTQDICLQAKITNCSCPGITVEKCFDVDPLPVCGTIDVIANTPKPLIPTPPVGFPYQYEICPGDYTTLEMVDPTQFKNCNPVWQYHFGPPTPSPTSPFWKDLGSSNSTQNTNTLPQTDPTDPAYWPSGATCIYYRIQCRPKSYPNSGCDPCLSNMVEICRRPAPPSGVITGAQQFCQNGPYPTLTITPNTAGNWTYCWYWNGILESTSTSPSFTATKPGNYWVEIKDDCQATKVGPYPVEECVLLPKIECSTVNPCACAGSPIILNGCNSQYTCANTGPLPLVYTWTTSNNGPCVPGPNGPCECEHTPDPINGTTYTLTIFDPNLGCSGTSKPLYIKPCN